MHRMIAFAFVALACDGTVGEGNPPGPAVTVPPGVDPLSHGAGLGTSELRRLTQTELRAVVIDLLGVDPQAELSLLPEDQRTPFDNDTTTQMPGTALVEGLRSFATEIASRVVADPALRDRVVGCRPSGPGDETCFRTFVERFGRRAFRRPLDSSELGEYAVFLDTARERSDFYVAVALALRAMMQDLEFVYRIEVGEPTDTPALRRLNDYELAARLSFFLWGTGPDEQLLDRVAAGELGTPADVRVTTARMLEDPRTRDKVARFHAMWLGYDVNGVPEPLQSSMRSESDALISRVLFEDNRPWNELFTFGETYVDDTLATHYGFSAPAGGGWVAYPDASRRGLLSHASFLTLGVKFGDSSPTMRGKAIFERIFCGSIPPPPGSVDTDMVPAGTTPDTCKPERYDMTRRADCGGCHQLMDPIGFGLEAYGPTGQFRASEPDRPHCSIAGDGELPGYGAFNGPAELAAIAVSSGRVEQCFTRHFYQYTVARPIDPSDERTIETLQQRFSESKDFVGLLLELVTSEAFRHRVVE